MKPAETEMREAILAAVKVGMSKGLKASDVVVCAMSFALSCAESCIVAAIDGKEDEVRGKLAEAMEVMAEELRKFKPPAGFKKTKEVSAWEQKR